MNLFQIGDFTLSSGVKSKLRIECDALSLFDVVALAEMIHQLTGPFSSVEGVPRGGLRLAKALQPYIGADGPHLIVDDVLTTGGSMERLRNGRQGGIVGAVVFARGRCPAWVRPVFQMPECFWQG